MGAHATAADLAAIYHVHLRTVRRWAARDHWRRTPTRPVRYNLTDADRSWRKRHEPHASAVRLLAKYLDHIESAGKRDDRER